MVKKNRTLRWACLILAVLIFSALPSAAQADDGDFEVEYEFSPNPTGYKGGDIRLSLTVRNIGASNITSLSVTINTQPAFSQSWTGTILPGSSNTLAFSVPFSEADVNSTRLLQVSMNNDADSNPDGLKIFRFEITGTRDIFDVSTTIEPESTVYHAGDAVNIRFTFTNNFETHAATNANILAAFSDETDRFFADFPEESQGTVMPGASAVYSFNYTFTESDIGDVYIHYVLQYVMVGADYYQTTWTRHIEVADRATISGYTLAPTYSPADPTAVPESPAAYETPIPENTSSAISTPAAVPSASPSLSSLPSLSLSAVAAEAKPKKGIPSTTILLIAIAALLLIIAVLLAVVLRKTKERTEK